MSDTETSKTGEIKSTATTSRDRVPEGMVCGDTFQAAGRRYVVIDGRRLITDDLPPKPEELKAVEIAEDIEVGEIVPSGYNRKHFNQARLQEMADSIRESGQMETAIVRWIPFGAAENAGKFELVAGERRWRGCKLAGVPVLRCHVRELTDSEAAELLLLSNLEREDLTAMEEATTYQQLLNLKDVETGLPLYSLERIAERVFGNTKKRDRVARTLKLLNLPEKMKEAVDSGEVTVKVAFLVGRIADKKSREDAAKAILKPNWEGRTMNFKEADAYISQHFQVNLKASKFALDDETLVPVKLDSGGERICGGACEKKTGKEEAVGCPFLAKYNPAFEIATGGGNTKNKGTGGQSGVDAMTCTNPTCYEMKLEALWQRTAAEIQAKSKVTLEIVPRRKAEVWFSKYHSGLEYNAPVVILSSQAEAGLTWEKILKGTEVPVLLACNRKGEPVMVANKKLAEASAAITHPDVFKSNGRLGTGHEKPTLTAAEMEKLKTEAEVSGKTLVALVEKAQKEKEAELKRKHELDSKIRTEAQRDALKELEAIMVTKGVCIEALETIWNSQVEASWKELHHYVGVPEDDNDELLQYPAKMGMTVIQLLPLLVVASILTASNQGGDEIEENADFVKLAKVYGISFKDILARVRKAYEIAEKDRLKAEAAKEAEETKKPKKNSSDPTDWTPESEASKATAADGQAKKKTEELVNCSGCGQANFTKRGLKAHVCKGPGKNRTDTADGADGAAAGGMGEVVSIEQAAKDLGLLDDDDYTKKSKEEQAAAIATGEADYVDCLGPTPTRKAPERKEYDRQRIALKRMVDKILKK